MKKLITLFVLILLICTPCFAWFDGEEIREATSALITADGIVKTGQGKLYSVLITSDGNTSGDRLDLYDGLTSTGTTMVYSAVLGLTDVVVPWSPPVATTLNTGLYANLTLNGTVLVVATYE